MLRPLWRCSQEQEYVPRPELQTQADPAEPFWT